MHVFNLNMSGNKQIDEYFKLFLCYVIPIKCKVFNLFFVELLTKYQKVCFCLS